MGKVHQHRIDQGRVWLFYTHFPASAQGNASQVSLVGHAIYFHALGTSQVQDRLACATPDQPTGEVLPHDHQGCGAHQDGDDGH